MTRDHLMDRLSAVGIETRPFSSRFTLFHHITIVGANAAERFLSLRPWQLRESISQRWRTFKTGPGSYLHGDPFGAGVGSLGPPATRRVGCPRLGWR